MIAAIIKRTIIGATMCMAVAYSAHAEYNGDDKNKRKQVIHIDARTGAVIKQRKPNMYVRFFNKVYNKYAKKNEEKVPVIVFDDSKQPQSK